MNDEERIIMIMGEMCSVLKSHKVNVVEAHEVSAELTLYLAELSGFTPEYFRELMTHLCDDYEAEMKSDG